ncbi:hypothetical protein OQI87_01135 [Lactobacillus kefiranofaciens]|uniref:hypothetical protein n=1 Tax=Lactobacillus kefiranofaciens TaxID=267818 RepID=UPI002469A0B7|nr:hypothetical protein [Lactobacillus kefiranofaciens]MDH5099779.1 hypothetical protein [Lactobacillus kefiranofaciens]
MEDFEELQNWIQKVNKEIDEKSIELAKLAMDKNRTYSSAMYWLDKNKPDVPHSYNATPVETFASGVVPGMFQTAKIEIRRKAFRQPIERKDK